MERVERRHPDHSKGEVYEGYRLSTGREIAANLGILGLTPDEPGRIYEGFDGDVFEELTPAEYVEIADFMIAQWQAFRAKAIEPEKTGASQA